MLLRVHAQTDVLDDQREVEWCVITTLPTTVVLEAVRAWNNGEPFAPDNLIP